MKKHEPLCVVAETVRLPRDVFAITIAICTCFFVAASVSDAHVENILIHLYAQKLTLMITFSFSFFLSFAWKINTESESDYISLPLKDKDTLSFLVTIKDKVDASGGDSEHDNLVGVPIKVIVLDENDNAPEFQNVSYLNFVRIANIYQQLWTCLA